MKLLLVNPYFGSDSYYYPALELAFLGTYIRDKKICEVEIMDPAPQGLTEQDILDRVPEFDLVGLTCYTERRFWCFELAQKIKSANPKCKLIVGGPHVLLLDEQVLKHYPSIDLIVRGEGEETLLEIIKQKPYEEISGITWRNDKGDIIRNKDRQFIENIDDLYVDYSLLPDLSEYIKDYAPPVHFQKLNQIYMLISRGCPFFCTFCGGPRIWKGTERVVSPGKVVERMRYLADRYAIEYFRFCDGQFVYDENWIIKFCSLLKSAKLKIKFRIDTRVGLSREALELLRNVGCSVISLGIESGAEKMLKKMNKEITKEEIVGTAKICRELGLWTIGTFIIGQPGETREDINETFELIKYFDLPLFYEFMIFPNTSIYNVLKSKGEICDETWFDTKYFDRGYGSRMVYCREFFPEALFTKEELDLLLLQAHEIYLDVSVCVPGRIIKRYGWGQGIYLLVKTIFKNIFIKLPEGNKIFNKLKGIKNAVHGTKNQGLCR